MNVWQWAGVSVATPILFISSLLFVDTALRPVLLHDELRLVTEQNRGYIDRIVVSFQGTQVSAETQTRSHRRDWAQWGKVIVPEFSREMFNREKIVVHIYEWLVANRTREVVLMGSSGGGQMVAELIRHMRDKASRIEIVGVIVNDVPHDQSDLVDTRAGIVKFWRAGWLQNHLSSLFWGASWNPPAPAPGTDTTLLAEHHAISKSYPLSGWGDQVREILNFTPTKANEFAGIPFVYLVSDLGGKDHDGVVRHSAMLKWFSAFGADKKALIRVQSPHAEFVAFEDAWREGFKKAFARILA